MAAQLASKNMAVQLTIWRLGDARVTDCRGNSERAVHIDSENRGLSESRKRYHRGSFAVFVELLVPSRRRLSAHAKVLPVKEAISRGLLTTPTSHELIARFSSNTEKSKCRIYIKANCCKYLHCFVNSWVNRRLAAVVKISFIAGN